MAYKESELIRIYDEIKKKDNNTTKTFADFQEDMSQIGTKDQFITYLKSNYKIPPQYFGILQSLVHKAFNDAKSY
jgi:hypothetical protein